ncbi:DUF1133 family protein [Klebsiella aerogenes]|jgi:hypothetical protein|nr:DUF1133 family protein [Klebsiella aerogenes]ELV3607166.1 DUF1133 family protein [Klebsiella oxytoca]DAV69053.1 MAG TPA: Protein of unknown function (DUF1133) [Caudoviricetes sp.]AML34657.1 Hypothetical protein EAG7_00911 [Klebsiella aerogenes]ATY08463.1 DUF1133 domain-containing protein [Klebsiella aerogenes]AXY31475.1 DUF1133 family protein [Klebsiella aerogenes]
MIYPTATGKAGEIIRLNTLESTMVQGRLKMWGRWSFIGGGSSGNMFNQLLASKKITKTAINEALRRMKKAGISKPELEAFLREMMDGNKKSHLAHCTDSEALIIDRVVGETFIDNPAMIALLHERYDGKGKPKKAMARDLNEKHPEWCLRTCESRIDVWLHVAERALYAPLCDAFGVNSGRFSDSKAEKP